MNFSDEIDKFVFNSCMELGVYPSPLNYRGFPKSVCTSVNNCVCHGIPDLRPMKDGDIVRYTMDKLAAYRHRRPPHCPHIKI